MSERINLTTDSKQRAYALLSLARNLGITVIAEIPAFVTRDGRQKSRVEVECSEEVFDRLLDRAYERTRPRGTRERRADGERGR